MNPTRKKSEFFLLSFFLQHFRPLAPPPPRPALRECFPLFLLHFFHAPANPFLQLPPRTEPEIERPAAVVDSPPSSPSSSSVSLSLLSLLRPTPPPEGPHAPPPPPPPPVIVAAVDVFGEAAAAAEEEAETGGGASAAAVAAPPSTSLTLFSLSPSPPPLPPPLPPMPLASSHVPVQSQEQAASTAAKRPQSGDEPLPPSTEAFAAESRGGASRELPSFAAAAAPSSAALAAWLRARSLTGFEEVPMKTARESKRASPRESAAAPRATTILFRFRPLPPPPPQQKSSATAPATATAAEEARSPQETAPAV